MFLVRKSNAQGEVHLLVRYVRNVFYAISYSYRAVVVFK